MEPFHQLGEQNDPLWAHCSTDCSGLQAVKGQEQQSYLQGHVPWSHGHFFFQLLGLSSGSFTLQTTLVQNVVEHLQQENRVQRQEKAAGHASCC